MSHRHLFVKTFDQARELVDLGFNLTSMMLINAVDNIVPVSTKDDYFHKSIAPAPLKTQIIDWFRTEHRISIYCYEVNRGTYLAYASYNNRVLINKSSFDYYESLDFVINNAIESLEPLPKHDIIP